MPPSLPRLLLALCAAASLSSHAQPGPSDPQIAQIVVTANQVDVDAGKLAAARSTSKDVKQFARQMITDHTAVNKQAVALVTRLQVKPEPSDTSRGLQQGGDDNVAKLKTLKGAQFDKAYVEQEVAYHQAVLDAIDKVLLPSARNAELKALIAKVRPAIAAHLEHARHLQARLGRTVSIEGMQFAPATVAVRAGDRITWNNHDVVPHTATAAGRFDSGAIPAGQSWTQPAPPPGRYEVVCTYHPGMKAVLVVQ